MSGDVDRRPSWLAVFVRARGLVADELYREDGLCAARLEVAGGWQVK